MSDSKENINFVLSKIALKWLAQEKWYFASAMLSRHKWNTWILWWGDYLSKEVNLWAPGRFEFKFSLVIFKPILVNGGWGISYWIALRWMPQDLTDDKSTLVQVIAWCRQATSHYLSQCWPRSMSPNGVTRPQWVYSSVAKSPSNFIGGLAKNGGACFTDRNWQWV